MLHLSLSGNNVLLCTTCCTNNTTKGGGDLYVFSLYMHFLSLGCRYPYISSHNWFVCLFVWGFSSHWRIFHTYEDVTINDGRLQILTNALHVWPLSNEGSLACHTYWDTGRSFRWSSQRIRDTHTYCPAFGSGALSTCFYGLSLSLLGFEHPTFRLRDDRSNRLRHRCGLHMPSLWIQRWLLVSSSCKFSSKPNLFWRSIWYMYSLAIFGTWINSQYIYCWSFLLFWLEIFSFRLDN